MTKEQLGAIADEARCLLAACNAALVGRNSAIGAVVLSSRRIAEIVLPQDLRYEQQERRMTMGTRTETPLVMIEFTTDDDGL